jgi:hypothetical protein
MWDTSSINWNFPSDGKAWQAFMVVEMGVATTGALIEQSVATSLANSWLRKLRLLSGMMSSLS